MSAERLYNLATIPGMSDLIGTMGVDVLNDIADSYSDMSEALEVVIANHRNSMDMCSAIQAAKLALAKAKGE